MKQKNIFLLLSIISFVFILTFFVGITFFQLNKKISNQIHKITLISGNQSRELNVEFAQTPSEYELGLMNRNSLDNIDGMLFIFETEQNQSFWMKNTYISLDITFFDINKKFTNVHKNAQPCINQPDENCQTYPSNGKIKYVLETKAGELSDEFLSEELKLDINSK